MGGEDERGFESSGEMKTYGREDALNPEILVGTSPDVQSREIVN